jgi:hypothetical protein
MRSAGNILIQRWHAAGDVCRGGAILRKRAGAPAAGRWRRVRALSIRCADGGPAAAAAGRIGAGLGCDGDRRGTRLLPLIECAQCRPCRRNPPPCGFLRQTVRKRSICVSNPIGAKKLKNNGKPPRRRATYATYAKSTQKNSRGLRQQGRRRALTAEARCPARRTPDRAKAARAGNRTRCRRFAFAGRSRPTHRPQPSQRNHMIENAKIRSVCVRTRADGE